MKIYEIKITNYKAFLGTHVINACGKNLFIYGENGSGKSSMYYALKDFFQSSVEDIDISALDNIFVTPGEEGKTDIRVTFKYKERKKRRQKTYVLNTTKNDTRAPGDTIIRDGNNLKSFLTYKHLLDIHHINKDDSINLFDLLINGVLNHFKFPLTGGRDLGALWSDVEEFISRKTDRDYNITKKKTDVEAAMKKFNEAFSELFKEDSPDYILKHARTILDYFDHNIALKLHFPKVRANKDFTEIEDALVAVDIQYAGKPVMKPHLFLNEARLSAIAISIYLGMIKRHIQGIPCKVLFLDDIFIGLDIANRLPLLDILESEFPDYQVFITTYDKPWFEYAKGFIDKSSWTIMEFYAKTCDEGFEIPVVFGDKNELIAQAKEHLDHCDYKAAAVYTRSAFEKIIRKYCDDKRIPVRFRLITKTYTVNDFWDAMNDKNVVPGSIKTDIEKYTDLVLNAFSHYNTTKHEIGKELEKAIKAVESLDAAL